MEYDFLILQYLCLMYDRQGIRQQESLAIRETGKLKCNTGILRPAVVYD